MKTFIRKYLFQRPTLFPWLVVIMLLGMVYYVVFGLIALWQGSEGVMAFLIIPYLSTFVVLCLMVDILFRRMFKDKLLYVWLTEVIIVFVWNGWFSYRNFYTTEFVTKDLTPLIVMVEAPKGKAPEKSLVRFRTTYTADINNVIITNIPINQNQWRSLRAKTEDGKTYSQAYTMMYMDNNHNSVTCDGKTYTIRFLMLEAEGLPHFSFSQKQFDSMRNVICETMATDKK